MKRPPASKPPSGVGPVADESKIPTGEFLLYQTEDGHVRVECRFAEETLWLTQALIAELFQRDVRTISEHLQNLYEEAELYPDRTIRKFRIVQWEGDREVTRLVDSYNLEAILAVGYRVRSPRGVQFRRWATERLSEYLVKGFTMDDVRLKNPLGTTAGVPDYFDELLERIRDIRASEQRMYLRVREMFALASDYNVSQSETTEFFQIIQNKLHFAITGHTAAETIRARARAETTNMGLTSWKGDRITKADVRVAKNYLKEPEIQELNRVVVMWLDFAEDQSRRRKQIFLRDWQERLDAFLSFNERRILHNAGSISKDAADRFANAEYDSFAAKRRHLQEAEEERTLRRELEAKAAALRKQDEP